MKAEIVVKNYLKTERVSRLEFDDLVNATEAVLDEHKIYIFKVLSWFRSLRDIEIEGWRTKESSRKIAKLIAGGLRGKQVSFYSLFCPSYKKGDGAFGFRIDGVGTTTEVGLKNLVGINNLSRGLGIKTSSPIAIFFDIAVEQAEKVLANNCIQDLETNMKNFRRKLPSGISFKKLSQYMPELFNEIGYKGIIKEPLPIPEDIFARIVERGKKFYDLFGWSNTQILERSRVIATSEALAGNALRSVIPNGIMVYTPTMLERAAVYSGMNYKNDPLPIIFPRKEDGIWDNV